jgi:hypothetical protein
MPERGRNGKRNGAADRLPARTCSQVAQKLSYAGDSRRVAQQGRVALAFNDMRLTA